MKLPMNYRNGSRSLGQAATLPGSWHLTIAHPLATGFESLISMMVDHNVSLVKRATVTPT
jgi:hypothetical protein